MNHFDFVKAETVLLNESITQKRYVKNYVRVDKASHNRYIPTAKN